MNTEKTKWIKLLYGKKVYVSKVDPCGVSGERVGRNSIWCKTVRSGFIPVVQMCLGRSVYYFDLKMCFSVGRFWVKTAQSRNGWIGERWI